MKFEDDLYLINSSSVKSNIEDKLSFYDLVKEKIVDLPVKELLERGYISKGTAAEIASFLSVTQPDIQLFRKSSKSDEINGKIWASMVQERANSLDLSQDLPNFSVDSLDSKFFDTLKALSCEPEELLKIVSLLNEKGIILIFEPTIKSSLVDGMVGKTITGRPFLGLSLRFKRLDNFWFTLFHELGHVCLHLSGLKEPILDSDDYDNDSDIEIEANLFAKNSLIPRALWNRSPLKFGRSRDPAVIYQVAKAAGVHPSIVAGRVRRDSGNYKLHADIVNEIDVRKLIWKRN